jgi:hypothetical protein
MKLPKQIKVGYADFKVVNLKSEYADHDTKEGHCSSAHHIISVRSDDRPDSEVANTLLHEVLHAIWYIWGNGGGLEEESAVTTMANGLLTVFKDNEGFVEFLSEAVTS